jgi:hypothetical protein
MLVTVAITTAVWILVTLVTPPEPQDKLVAFYRRVRPAGPGWKRVAERAPDSPRPRENLVISFVNWVFGCALIYACLFGIGRLIFRQWMEALVCMFVAAISAAVISRNLSRADWQETAAE